MYKSFWTCGCRAVRVPPQVFGLSRSVYTSDLSNVDIPNKPFHEFLWQNADKFSEKPALICGKTGRSYTYKDAAKFSSGISSWFIGTGASEGDVVAAVLENCPEYPILLAGVAGAGMALTPINNNFTAREIVQQIQAAGTKWVVTEEIGKAKISVGMKSGNKPKFITLEGKKGTNLAQLMTCQDNLQPHKPIGPETIVQLPYSSGTTGLPKGVMLTHNNLVSNCVQMAHPGLDFFNPDDRVVIVNPLYHVFGMNTTTLNLLISGGTAITLPKFEPKSFIEALEKFKPTVLQLPPPLISFLADHPSIKPHHLESLRYVMVGAAPVGPSLEQRFRKKAPGIPLREGWGMTELTPMALMTRPGGEVLGSTGQLIPSTKARIVDIKTGVDVCQGEVGELLIQGPQVMAGYLNNLEATKETIVDGWMHTGDIAKCDEKGFFFIVDRLKELIKVKGLQVAPAELEDLIREHSGVKDCAVVGVEDDRSGQVPMAVVVKAEEKLTEQEVSNHVEERAANHKHLAGGVVFVSSIPRSAAGKILRRELKDKYAKTV